LLDEAFPDDSPPMGDKLTSHATGVGSEYDYVKAYFEGKRWKDVTLDSLRSGYPGPASACLNFMSPEAFRYYLPAFLIITMEDPVEADAIVDTVISSLRPPEFPDADFLDFVRRYLGEESTKQFTSQENLAQDRRIFAETVALLSDMQKRAVRAFLQFMTGHYPQEMDDLIRPAMRQYWNLT
jgi:hypothetical protein